MSVIEAEVEVDETDIPNVQLGQTGEGHDRRRARPRVQGPRHRNRQQPHAGDHARRTPASGRPPRSRWSITIEDKVPDVRPGFTCTAEITTATRTKRRRGADPGADRARDAVRPVGHAGARAAAAAAEPFLARSRRRGRRRPSRHPATSARRPKACSSCRDGRAVFTPVKIGIAGEQYFEVTVGAQGRRSGDHRAVRLGARAGRRAGRPPAGQRRSAVAAVALGTVRATARHARMGQIFESVRIALQAIWANKLRSFMTVLGNIVAVTSIVTVVTLIQGMNAMVSTAIVSDVGADSFTIQRLPPIRSEDDEERTRNNPLLTLDEAEAIRGYSPRIGAVMAQAQRRRHGVLPHQRARERAGAGRDQRLRPVHQLQRRARPADEPGGGRAQPPGGAASAGTWPTSCSGRPTRWTSRSASPACPSASSASARRRARSSATRRTPSWSSRWAPTRSCSARGSRCSSWSSRGRPPEIQAAKDDATVALRVHAAAQARRRRQLRHVHLRHASWTSTARRRPASSPCWSAWWRCRWSSAASSS